MRTIAEKVFSSSEEVEDYDFSSASEKTIQELNTNYRSVYPLSLESPAIAVDFFGASFFKPEQLKDLLKIKTQLVSLNLDKMPVTDSDLQTIGQFTNLRKLNLSFTKITGTGLSALSNLSHLKSLSLTNTTIKPDDFKNLESLKELRHLYLWNSGFSVAEMEQLKKKYPEVDIEMGSRIDTMVVKLNAPIIQNENQIITDSPLKLQLKHYVPGVTIRYTLDGTEPDSLQSLVYTDKSMINNQVLMKAKAFKPGWHSSDLVQYQFYQATYRPDTVILLKPTDSNFKGKGGSTLNDLVKGSTNYGDGKWIAYRKNNMECILVFSKPVNVSDITISSLINLGAYIFPLKSISISGGTTASNLKTLYHASPKQDTTTQGGYLVPYECKFPNTLVRYIKVVVVPYGKLPKPLQLPKNDLGWLFVDEIFVN